MSSFGWCFPPVALLVRWGRGIAGFLIALLPPIRPSLVNKGANRKGTGDGAIPLE